MRSGESWDAQYKRETRRMLLGFLLAVVAVIAAIVLTAWLGSSKECEDYAEITGEETKYSFWSCCYIRVNSRWVCKGALRAVDDGEAP